jgi:glycosyltransferase involved in cell wall biosynthesis
MTSVSVIIPAYNVARFVAGALDSVLAQSMQDFELIVVDDGSTDETARIVQSYLSDSRIRYIFQGNRGLPGARNAGAKISKGEYLAFLDADDFFAPNALELMRQGFEQSRAAWSIVGVLKLEQGRKTIRRVNIPPGDLFLAILDNDFVTRSPFYPRHEFFNVGMYDEEIRMREDWDLNIRMIAAGRPFVVIDEPLYLYSRSEGSITTGNYRKLFSYTEELLKKHHKQLADSGHQRAAHLYAKNMWDLARRYFYQVGDYRESFRCASESLRYDLNLSRLLHPLKHHFRRALNERPPGVERGMKIQRLERATGDMEKVNGPEIEKNA